MNVKSLFVVVMTAGVLAGCGSKINCVQKGFDEDLKALINSNMEGQIFSVYWATVVSEQVEVSTSGVKELAVADNKKSATCAATVSITTPLPDAKTTMTNSILLGLRSSMSGDLLKAMINNPEPTEKIVGTITYTVTSLEKPAQDGREVEVSVDKVKGLVQPMLYRTVELMGTALAKPIGDGSSQIWTSAQLSDLTNQINGLSDLPVDERKKRVCVIGKTAKFLPYDSYMAYLSILQQVMDGSNPMLAVGLRGSLKEPPLSTMVELENEANASCAS